MNVPTCNGEGMEAAGNYPLAASPEVEEIAPSPTEGKVLNGMKES